MPELPEVEIQVRQLRRYWSGQIVLRSEVRDPKLRGLERLAGQRLEQVRRRGKYIVASLSDGRYLLIHLRMTGWWERQPTSPWRWAVETARGAVYLTDPRRFATARVVDSLASLAHLGAEPLRNGWDPRLWRKGQRPIKSVLLDQRLVAGVGNIYACEALWRARINPRQPAASLRDDQLRTLQRALRTALRAALRYGPRIFEVQTFCVYDRADQPCRRCGTPIERFVLGKRGTYWCPACQRG
ncbi:MAG: DNA-formamidopyrimidine glycosylase family protein [Verrucomicrobiae bacterium]|nr:DNA-formamidopyrimidine glycosylase family protein [Verrucomicrobiae bacterium]